MKQKLVFVCMLFMACSFGAHGQDTTGRGIISKLIAFLNTHNSEKAYLQFDRSYYVAGDTIYFKAYVTQGEQHQLSNLSGVLHADLISPDNKIASSIKLQLINGLAWGDFFLPDSLPKGNYRVRAYTQLMRNEGDGAFFERLIPVGSAEAQKIAESISAGSRAGEKKADVQFLPEGGNLVSGIKSKIAFKAIGADGRSINVSGVVLDNENKDVCQFTSTHLSMVFFYLQPQGGKSYAANVTYADGGKDRCVCGERNGRQAGAIKCELAHKLSCNMLRVGGTAAVAGQQNFAARAHAADACACRRFNRRKQCVIRQHGRHDALRL